MIMCRRGDFRIAWLDPENLPSCARAPAFPAAAAARGSIRRVGLRAAPCRGCVCVATANQFHANLSNLLAS